METPHEILSHGCLLTRLVVAGCLLLATAVNAGAQQTHLVSPEVSAGGRVTFRVLAPEARSVTVKGIRHQPDLPMTRGSDGVWSVTVGPLPADIYSYQFVIDSATVTDPSNRDTKKYFTSESLFEVPGKEPILAAAQPVPHGTLHHQVYASAVRKRDAGVWIYTPPGYDPRASALYPTVYLLHGFGDGEEAWIDAGHANVIVDNLIAQGRVKPMIIVMPFGHPIPVENHEFGKDYAARNLAAMQADLLGQLIPLIEHDYRADPSAERRAIVGLSMGGGQALQIGIGNPGTFRWVGGFSSSVPEADLNATFAELVKGKPSRPELLWVGIGKDDFLFKRNQALHAWLQQKGVVHTWVVSEGGHEWPNWRAYLPQFLELIFR